MLNSSMGKKELFWTLAVKTVKTLVVLFTLFAIGYFVDALPFARSLPFISFRLPVSVFLNAVVSLLAIIVFVKFGSEASPSVDGLLDFVPKAGELTCNALRVFSLLFAYYAFQDAVFPFIADFEWLYQAVFLGFTLFFLVRIGLQVYYASEEIGKFLVGALRPYRSQPPAEK